MTGAGAKHIRVVSAVIERDGRFLITQRRAEAVLPLLWEFPGGRVEDGETDAQALEREIGERIGTAISVGDALTESVHNYSGYTVTLAVYQAQLTGSEPQAKRVNDFRWVKSTEFGDYRFPPADQATMDTLLGFTN